MARQLASRLMRLPSESPVWQQAATLEPQALWMGMATVEKIVSLKLFDWKDELERTDGDAQAVSTNEVLAAVAAGNLLAVAALGLGGLGVDLDLGVLVGGTALGSSEGDGGHGGDEERLDEGHFGGLGLVGKGWWEASVVLEWID